jgi:hypothetical protein
MMRSLGKYVRKKKLEVNVEKTKMMVFNKRKRKRKRMSGSGKGEYLGYNINERATDKVHMREIERKANKLVGCVWGIGQRKWESDFRRRVMMFESMVESVLMYGVEIWGGKKQEEAEKVQEKNLRRVLEVDRETPDYVVGGECKRNRLR